MPLLWQTTWNKKKCDAIENTLRTWGTHRNTKFKKKNPHTMLPPPPPPKGKKMSLHECIFNNLIGCMQILFLELVLIIFGLN